jgi:hypothetical protein
MGRSASVTPIALKPRYMGQHLIPHRKTPRKALMQALADASEGKVSCDEVLAHFYRNLAA